MIEKAMDYKTCSDATGLSPRTLRNYVSRKMIPYIKLGKAVRFSPSKIEAWMEERSVPELKKSINGEV